MNFCIKFLDEREMEGIAPVPNARAGKIAIGDFKETFWSTLDYWSPVEYQKQWKEGLESIIQGHPKSWLITSIHHPLSNGYMEYWTLNRKGNEIYITNGSVLYMDFVGDFDPAKLKPDDYVRDHDEMHRKMMEYKASGEWRQDYEISEWTVPIEDIKEFLNKLGCDMSENT